MNPDQSSVGAPPKWLVDWLHDAERREQKNSLLLDAECIGVDLHGVSCDVAGYLNEFDGSADCQWRAFEVEELRYLAGDPSCRKLLSADSVSFEDRLPPSDLERIARRLASLGGVILEGDTDFDLTADLRHTFHVCLCCHGPRGEQVSHMWINPSRFSPETLGSIIADSFLNWSSHRGVRDPALQPSEHCGNDSSI